MLEITPPAAGNWHFIVDKNKAWKDFVCSQPAQRMNCTVSAVIHSHHQLLNGGIKASYRHLLEQPQLVDRLIIITDEQWQDLQQEGDPRRSPLWSSPTIWMTAKFRLTRRALRKRSFTARYSEEKQHLTLFNAFRKVSAQRPDARLHTYGVGPLRRKLSDQVKAWGLENVIKINGFTSDIAAVHRHACCTAHSVQPEGQSVGRSRPWSGTPLISFATFKYGPRDILQDRQADSWSPTATKRRWPRP